MFPVYFGPFISFHFFFSFSFPPSSTRGLFVRQFSQYPVTTNEERHRFSLFPSLKSDKDGASEGENANVSLFFSSLLHVSVCVCVCFEEKRNKQELKAESHVRFVWLYIQ